jgi:plastin-1
MDPLSSDLFTRIHDGIVLSKLINKAQADTVDERALNMPAAGKKDMNLWEKQENNNIVINSAKSIGCQVVNIHAPDLIRAFEDHKEHLVLGLVWQIVKQQLLNKISIAECPELVCMIWRWPTLC